MRSRNRKGYIAIIASIVITTIVGVVALVFSSSNFLGRYDTLALESKRSSRALAEGCVEYARLRIAQNPTYRGGDTVAISSFSCEVVSVVTEGDNFRVTASSTVNRHTTALTALIAKSDLSLIERSER